MYQEPQMEITKIEPKDVDTVGVSPGDFAGQPDIGYNELFK